MTYEELIDRIEFLEQENYRLKIMIAENKKIYEFRVHNNDITRLDDEIFRIKLILESMRVAINELAKQ